MKYTKMLGLLAIAAAALMAFAGVASATTLTSPTGTTYTGKIVSVNEGHTTLHAANGISVSCPGEVSGSVEQHGTGVTVKGKNTALTFGTALLPCTNSDVVHVSALGELEIHNVSGGYNGTLTSTGTTVNVTDNTGVSCGFLTKETDVGTLTAGTPATLHIASAKIPRHSGSILCGATGTWTGSYKVTTPGSLFVDA